MIGHGLWRGERGANAFGADVDDARSEDILNALDAAYEDGFDIANMSLGDVGYCHAKTGNYAQAIRYSLGLPGVACAGPQPCAAAPLCAP